MFFGAPWDVWVDDLRYCYQTHWLTMPHAHGTVVLRTQALLLEHGANPDLPDYKHLLPVSVCKQDDPAHKKVHALLVRPRSPLVHQQQACPPRHTPYAIRHTQRTVCSTIACVRRGGTLRSASVQPTERPGRPCNCLPFGVGGSV